MANSESGWSSKKLSPKKVRGRLRVPVVYGLKKSYFFFFAAFFAGFFAAFFLVAIVFYSPFFSPSVMEHCDLTSSQFVLCIESTK